jgi:hypothetical protein
MPDTFDPYREALVMEATTVWGDEYDDWDAAARRRIEQQLHADPEKASTLDYIRMHTGFRRQITVTPADIERLS